MTSSSRFAVRVALLEGAVLVGTACASAIVEASPYWGPNSLGSYAFMAFLGVPVVLLFASAARTPAQLAGAAACIIGFLAWCGYSMASTASSTAGLVFLSFPSFGTMAGAVAAVGRWVHDRRIHQS